ncbi:MAG: acyl-CoA dehydrogenase [Proteobacteria bacterium]|nr:MAG: acyl-CoA dehydrogenase [Pseudomonadota bacterium]
MIQLRISSQVEEFRQSFRVWLQRNPPPKSEKDSSLQAFVKSGRDWQAKLASGNWVAVHWPKDYGGRALSLVEEAVVQEELVQVNSPQLLGLFGLTMVGPVLIAHGTTEQKSRYLQNILSAKEIWCQGFSEPGAGSDLANVSTKARLAKNGFYVSGQKIWTSFAQIADWCFLLCRTSEEKSRHQGLSYLLVDMKSKGIDVRPLKQISGDDEFNEVFFDEVFVPKENIVGEVGEGWKIAISTLMYERVVLTFARQLQSEVALRGLIKRAGPETTQDSRSKLTKEIARACAVRALAYQHLLEYAAGKTPGPEGSLDKLFWSESFQSIAKLALEFDGQAAVLSENSELAGANQHRYLYSRGRTIAAGTSEIQRNIIAERVLNLPRLTILR